MTFERSALPHRYLVALGSNRRLGRIGGPRAVLDRAMKCLDLNGLALLSASRIHDTAPVGPSQRRYANAAALVASALEPEEMLERLRQIERNFNRLRRGQRWRERTLDLDIVLWNDGIFASGDLLIPHPAFRERSFVLTPASEVARGWRDPVTGFTIAQLLARLTKPAPALR